MNHLLKKVCYTSYLTFTTLLVTSCSSVEEHQSHQAQEILNCDAICIKNRKHIISKINSYDSNGDILKLRTLRVQIAEYTDDEERIYRIGLDTNSGLPDIQLLTRAKTPGSQLKQLKRNGITTLDRFGTTSVVTYPFIKDGCAHKILLIIKDDTGSRNENEFIYFTGHAVGSNCNSHEKKEHPIIDGIQKSHGSAHGSGTRD